MKENISKFYLELVGARVGLEIAPKEAVRLMMRDEVAGELLDREIGGVECKWEHWAFNALAYGIDTSVAANKRAVTEGTLRLQIYNEKASKVLVEVAHLRGQHESRLYHVWDILRALAAVHAEQVYREIDAAHIARLSNDDERLEEAKELLAEAQEEVAKTQRWLASLEYNIDELAAVYRSTFDKELDRLSPHDIF